MVREFSHSCLTPHVIMKGRNIFLHHHEADNRPQVEISCDLWEGPQSGAEEGLWLLSLKSDRNNMGMITIPISISSSGEDVELRRREGWGKGIFKIYFTFYCPALSFFDNKFN